MRPPPHRRRTPPAANGSESEAGTEILWLGGLFELPVFVHDEEGEPYRPVSALWVEASTELIVAQLLVSPDETAGALAASLRTAMESPLAGSPRRPTLIRVATRRLAAEIREAFGAELAVEVAATPELDPIVEEMVEAIAADGEAPSYLDGGRLAPELLAELFRYARDLHRAAPWRRVGDDEPLRLDAPELGIEGGCLVVVGGVGIARGFMLFPSYAAYESFAASDPELDGVDLGGDVLHLLFERASGLPDSMRREVSRHGWPLASRRAYPVPERRERDGTPRPLTARDVEVLLLCAAALSHFFEEDEEAFTPPGHGPVTETYLGEGFSLSLTFPYADASLYGSPRDVPRAVPEEEPRAPRVGRNDPCPCGSGRKYKKCHLAADEEARAREAGGSEAHDVVPFADPMTAMPLAVPWALYQARLGDGASVAVRYLAERGGDLSEAERSWIEAQSAAWLSIWEVRAVEPGCALTLHDALTGEERTVREASASRSAVVYDALLARVVDYGAEHLLCGTHPRSLTPRDAA